MLNVYKAVLCFSALATVPGCLTPAIAHGDDINYAVRVRGDDALTMSLVNLLEKSGTGYRFIPIDQASEFVIVIFITSNLEFISNKSGDSVRFEADFVKDDKILSTKSGQCPIGNIRKCKIIILNHLRLISHKGG